MLRTTSVIASGPSGRAKQALISARSAPALNERWSLRRCSTTTPSSSIARSRTASSSVIMRSSSALTGGRDSVATMTRPTRPVETIEFIASLQRAVQLTELAPQQLAGGTARQIVDQMPPARPLVRRQDAGTFLQGGTGGSGVGRSEEESDRVDAVGVGNAHGGGILEAGCPGRQTLFEIDQIDPAATDLDQRVLAARKTPAAPCVAREQVGRAEVPVAEGLGLGLRAIEVA